MKHEYDDNALSYLEKLTKDVGRVQARVIAMIPNEEVIGGGDIATIEELLECPSHKWGDVDPRALIQAVLFVMNRKIRIIYD